MEESLEPIHLGYPPRQTSAAIYRLSLSANARDEAQRCPVRPHGPKGEFKAIRRVGSGWVGRLRVPWAGRYLRGLDA